MGLLFSKDDYQRAIDHFKKAATLCLTIEDYLGQCYNNHNIARLYFRNEQLQLAMMYNDSSIIGVENAVSVGYDENWIAHRAYRFRGEIFRALGQLDSAYYYLKKGADMEIAHVKAAERQKVIEIDARYNDEKKAQQIAEQAEQIQLERKQRNLLLIAFFFFLVLSGTLVYLLRLLLKANRKVKKQAKRLVDIDVAKSHFFANISHELRTPLALISGPVNNLLQHGKLDLEKSQLLQMIQKNTERLKQLVNQILDLQKLELSQLEPQESPTLLLDFFSRHFAQFESLAKTKHINYRYSVDISPQISAKIDREKLQQIINNLLSNAIKFTPQGGNVRSEVLLQDDHIKLQVSDTGNGIHPDDLPYIFDRFFQTTRPDRPVQGGTGIGLAICREYTHLLGGEIQVESNSGTGTTFIIVVPATGLENSSGMKASRVSSRSANASPPINSGKVETSFSVQTDHQQPNILIVEDNLDLQEYLQTILRTHFKLTVTQNGKEAVKVLKKANQYDLILSDVMMPGMDGYQLLDWLKQNDATRHIPVIMLTARAGIRDKLKALRLGVDDYLLKPFNEEELKLRIHKLLHNQRIRQQFTPANPKSKDQRLLFSKSEQTWLKKLEIFVSKNLSNENLKVSVLAQEFTMSESTLLRKIKRLTGLTPNEYIKEVRLNTARSLLEKKAFNSVTEVAM